MSLLLLFAGGGAANAVDHAPARLRTLVGLMADHALSGPAPYALARRQAVSQLGRRLSDQTLSSSTRHSLSPEES